MNIILVIIFSMIGFLIIKSSFCNCEAFMPSPSPSEYTCDENEWLEALNQGISLKGGYAGALCNMDDKYDLCDMCGNHCYSTNDGGSGTCYSGRNENSKRDWQKGHCNPGTDGGCA